MRMITIEYTILFQMDNFALSKILRRLAHEYGISTEAHVLRLLVSELNFTFHGNFTCCQSDPLANESD